MKEVSFIPYNCQKSYEFIILKVCERYHFYLRDFWIFLCRKNNVENFFVSFFFVLCKFFSKKQIFLTLENWVRDFYFPTIFFQILLFQKFQEIEKRSELHKEKIFSKFSGYFKMIFPNENHKFLTRLFSIWSHSETI